MKKQTIIGQAKCEFCGYVTTTGGIKAHRKYCPSNPDKELKSTRPIKQLSTKETNKIFGKLINQKAKI